MSGGEVGYNGWKNYETWAVALWLDNDEGTYNESREMARRINAEWEAAGGSDAGERAPVGTLADEVETWVVEMAPDLGGSLWADLLNAALSEVDWYELAENYLSELS